MTNENKLVEDSMAVKIDETTCIGCEACIDACPVEALFMKDEKAKCDEEKCVDCGACVDVCPVGAISL
jgi:formate hydrogenlyase subunit 6/NADH:ubiquinone oxidoreductase subunit I